MQPDSPPEARPEPRALLRWGLALAFTVIALAVLTLVPAKPLDPSVRMPRGIKMLTFPVGNVADLARFMLWLRLGWLVLAPAGRPLRPIQRLLERLRLPLHPPPEADLAPWRSFAWRRESLIALGLLGVAVAMRWVGARGIDPDGIPFGSDWHSFVQTTRAFMTGDWTLYNPDKLPLYSFLAAKLAPWVGGDPARAGQLVSWLSMTLVTPALYLAVRLALGRTSAIGATLLFIVSGMLQYIANANTSYGLFTALMVLAVSGAAGAVFTGRLWTSALLGVALGLGMLTEVKTLTVAIPLLVLVAGAWLMPGRTWKERIVGPVLVAVPIIGLSAMLHLVPVTYTQLERKLDVQTQEVARFLAEQPAGAARESADPGALSSRTSPSLNRRLAMNLARAKAVSPIQWPALLLLALGGLLAPLVARGRIPLRSRLAGMGGPLLLAGAVASAAGAFAWLFMDKYLFPVLPFFFALLVHGGWCLASWMAPAGSPRLLRQVMGWAAVVALLVMVIPLHEIKDLPQLQRRAITLHLREAVYDNGIQMARAAWVAAGWIDREVERGTPLWLCDQAQVTTFLVKPHPLFPLLPPSGNAIEACLEGPKQPASSSRVWVVDDLATPGLVQQMNGDTQRFQRLLRVPVSTPADPRSVWLFRENTSGRGQRAD